MLKKIYAIMECYARDDIWPDYDEFKIGDNMTLILSEKDGVRAAHIIQPAEWIDAERGIQSPVFKFEISIPDKFPQRWFVNHYCLTREYGGPEEGGWYYDAHNVISSKQCVDEDEANKIAAAIDEKIDYKDQAEHPYADINSNGHEYVEVSNAMAMQPRRPRYE